MPNFFLTIILSCLQVPLLLCRLLTMTIPILSWYLASSSFIMPNFFLTIILSCLQVPLLLCRLNHDNSYIVMVLGKFLIHYAKLFLDNYFVMSTSSFTTMQTFNDHVMVQSSSFIMPNFFLIIVMSTSTWTRQFHHSLLCQTFA